MLPELLEPPSHTRRHLLIVLKLGVSAILLAVLLRSAHVTELWASARQASLPWLAAALAFYLVNVLFCVWRWRALLGAQNIHLPARSLLSSYLVALFFNNFLPSNIGGDVIRITDTAGPARSKTLATMVVLADRGIGLIVLVLIAAVGATMAAGIGVPASWLWLGFLFMAAAATPVVLAPSGVGRLLQPLTVLHPEWVGGRIDNLTTTLERFRSSPLALGTCFAGAVLAQGSIVLFYFAVATALGIDATVWHLAVIVPLSFVVQMLPVSMNGFGVREATFAVYFVQIGLSKSAGLLVSLVGAALIMLVSLIGAPVYVSRGHRLSARPAP